MGGKGIGGDGEGFLQKVFPAPSKPPPHLPKAFVMVNEDRGNAAFHSEASAPGLPEKEVRSRKKKKI